MTRFVDLSIDDKKVLSGLKRLIDQGENPRVMLLEIGEHPVESTKQRFADQVDPDSQLWAPLSAEHLQSARKSESRYPDQKLLLTGQLAENIFQQVEGNTLLVGSPEPYAPTHQFGAERGEFGKTSRGAPIPFGDIPARRFIGLSEPDREMISEVVADRLLRSVDGN